MTKLDAEIVRLDKDVHERATWRFASPSEKVKHDTAMRLVSELTTFVDALTADFGRPERRAAMAQYITGLLLDGERNSIEPIAARLVDRLDQIQAMRQRLQQCVVVSPWDAG